MRIQFLSAFIPVIVLAVLSIAPKAAQPAGGNAGKAAFDKVCADCHGANARGKKEPDDTPSLVPMNKSYDDLLAIVRQGGCKMPSISPTQVSDDEVQQILGYLKSLGGSEAAAGAAAANSGC